MVAQIPGRSGWRPTVAGSEDSIPRKEKRTFHFRQTFFESRKTPVSLNQPAVVEAETAVAMAGWGC